MKSVNILLLSCCLVLLVAHVEASNSTAAIAAARVINKDDCDKCGPTGLIGCRKGRCYYKCIRRCLGPDNKFYYESLKFNLAGQR